MLRRVARPAGADPARSSRNDGPTGLELFERERMRIDLIMLDRSMPELPGEVVLERLGALEAAVPIVLLSGHPGATGAGGRTAAVLAKPTDRATLLRTVRECSTATDVGGGHGLAPRIDGERAATLLSRSRRARRAGSGTRRPMGGGFARWLARCNPRYPSGTVRS